MVTIPAKKKNVRVWMKQVIKMLRKLTSSIGKLVGKRFFNGFRAKSSTHKTLKCHKAVKCPIRKRTSSLDAV